MGEVRACELRVRSFLRTGADFLVPDWINSPTITCEVIKIHEGRQDKLNMLICLSNASTQQLHAVRISVRSEPRDTGQSGRIERRTIEAIATIHKTSLRP